MRKWLTLLSVAATTLLISHASISICLARSLVPIQGSFAPMLEKVIPAIVTLRVTGEAYPPIEFKTGSRTKPKSTPFKRGGSGVIVDSVFGYILTNHHVVEGATKIEISLSDGRRALARVVGRDIGTDLAVLQVDSRPLPSIEIGDSDTVRVGDVVVAIGNPFGLEGSASAGIVSAVMRSELGIEEFEDFFQIDAHIYSGNSGGALVNTHGELIGINSALGGRKGQIGGIGFAIPINMAKVIQAELIAHGTMRRGSPGLIVEDLPPDWTGGDSGNVMRGAMVKTVIPGTAAEAAGIRPGDIIVGVASKPVRSAAEYATRVSIVPLGTTIQTSLYSNGREKTLPLVISPLVLKPDKQSLPRASGNIAGATVGSIVLGGRYYGRIAGVEVLDVPARTPAYRAGLEVGDVITSIDGATVRTWEELTRRIEAAGSAYRVDFVRDGIPWWLRANR